MSAFGCFGKLCSKRRTEEVGSKSQIFPDVYRTSRAAGGGVQASGRSAGLFGAKDEAASTSQPSATNSQAPKREPSEEHPSTPLNENFEAESTQTASEVSPIEVHIGEEVFDQIEGRRPRSEAPPSRTDCASTSGHCRTDASSQAPLDGRPAPTNPITFLQAVIDDVQHWQAQVADIHAPSHAANGNQGKTRDKDQLKDEVMKTSIGTLQRRNEELLGELDRLSSRLYRAEKEIVRVQGKLDEYILKENKTTVDISSNASQHHEALESPKRRSKGTSWTFAPGTQEPSEENTENIAEVPVSEKEAEDQLNSLMVHNATKARGVPPSGLSKEEYFLTENKCLKMWIAKMQASISHMETEVFAMRQEKSDLLELLSQYGGLNKPSKRWQQPMPTLSEATTEAPPAASAKPTKARPPGMTPALNRLATRNARQASRSARLRNIKTGGVGSLKRDKISGFDSLGSASNYVSTDKELDYQSMFKITPTWKP